VKETIIDLIRHGEPVGGARLRGTQDDPLSELGWEQMRASVGDYSPWSSIISSPLKRCHGFAEELSARHGLGLSLDERFREIGFGAWEGKTTAELMEEDPQALQRYWQDPDQCTPPGGERLSDFVQRIQGAWEETIQRNTASHQLLVCHGGVIRAVLVKVLGMPVDKLWNFDVPYANVTRVVYHHFKDGSQAAQLRFHQARFAL
jgi:alpha-ribazole phosphatase